MRLAPGLVTPGGAIPWASGSVAKTYADFQADALARWGPAVPWGTATDPGGIFVQTTGAGAGSMSGSSFNGSFNGGFSPESALSRAVQHAFLSSGDFTAATANGDVTVIFTSEVGTGDMNATSRNGYTSTSATGVRVFVAHRFIWWDRSLNKARQWGPNSNGPVTDYLYAG